jgi:hypothetical protein
MSKQNTKTQSETNAMNTAASSKIKKGMDFNDILSAYGPGVIVDILERARSEQRQPNENNKPTASADLNDYWEFDVEKINAEYALVLRGSKALIINDRRDIAPGEDIRFLTLDAFHAWFSNRRTRILPRGREQIVSWATAWLRDPARRQYAGVEFFPNPDDAAGTPHYLNLWRGFSVEPSSQGTYKTFRDHVFNNICNSDPELFQFVFGWCAQVIQHPREKPGTAIVLRGQMGAGKSKLGEVIGSLMPSHYRQVDEARYITGNFNQHMAACLILQADEAVWAGDKAAEGRLKGLITSETQMIESKNIDAVPMKNYVRILMTSNEDWVVPAGKDERRFCVLDVHPRCAQNHEYFSEMDEELNNGGRSRLLFDLQNFDLSKVNLRKIPKTNALLEQKLRSLDPTEGYWYGRLRDAAPLSEQSEWQTRVVTNDLYQDFIKSAIQVGISRRRTSAEFGQKMKKLVPDLRKVRPLLSAENGGKKRIWCYELPSLSNCRDSFETLLGQAISWPREVDVAGREDPDDDPI